MFTFRLTTKAENEKFENKCSITMSNSMRCTRRINRIVNNEFMCEGHFQLALAAARNNKEELMDLAENSVIQN